MAPPLAVSNTEVLVQVSMALVGETAATGGAVLWLTTDDAVAVHPLPSVTVTV